MTTAVRDGAAKILLVDDRSDNLVALEAILHGLPVEPVSVTSGEDALKCLLRDDFAVILLDANMPGMDGFETASHIKQRQRTRHVPIIFLTAAEYDPHLAYRGYQAGAVDYLAKPFDPWVLRSKITVFVELWAAHAEVTALAAEHAALRAGIERAIAAVEESPESAGDVLRELRSRATRRRRRTARTITPVVEPGA